MRRVLTIVLVLAMIAALTSCKSAKERVERPTQLDATMEKAPATPRR